MCAEVSSFQYTGRVVLKAKRFKHLSGTYISKSFGEGCNVSEKSFINVYMDMITRAKNKIYYVTF